jgi:hypothetical protein
MTCHYMMLVRVWCDTNGSMPAITGTTSCFWDHKITAIPFCCIICQHLSDPTEPEPFLQGDNVTPHTAKKILCLIQTVCLWQKNKRRSVASSFVRSKTMWILCGHIKCTEIILTLKTSERKHSEHCMQVSSAERRRAMVYANWIKPF